MQQSGEVHKCSTTMQHAAVPEQRKAVPEHAEREEQEEGKQQKQQKQRKMQKCNNAVVVVCSIPGCWLHPCLQLRNRLHPCLQFSGMLHAFTGMQHAATVTDAVPEQQQQSKKRACSGTAEGCSGTCRAKN
jgi:hypothetical protein